MQIIKGATYTHLSFTNNSKPGKLLSRYRNFEKTASRTGIQLVGKDDGFPIKNYRELVERVSEIAYENTRLVLTYRGQGTDYRVKGNSNRSAIYPTIFRDSWKNYIITSNNRPLYFQKLSKLVREMRPKVFKKIELNEPEEDDDISIINQIESRNYREQMWAIIQHYELFPTPMVDVTQSLQVACSFALDQNPQDFGYIYVFGLPGIGGSVSYSVDDEMCVARLQTVCPPKAIRAHFQEGLLISRFPSVQRRGDNWNLSNRMLAKFKISKNGFWSDGFHALDRKTLLPDEDPFAGELKEVQMEVFPSLYDGLEILS